MHKGRDTMIQRILRVLRKIKGSLQEDGILGTLDWLWNCFRFKFFSPPVNYWPDFPKYYMGKEEKKMFRKKHYLLSQQTEWKMQVDDIHMKK